MTLLLNVLEDTAADGSSLLNEECYYIAPTFESGKKILWNVLKSMARMEDQGGLIKQAHENTAVLTLINGRRISIKGADRPDTLRGVGLSYAVLDEYAFMKSDVWELIIRPALARSRGGALFIGTPSGKNHFYDLYQKAISHPAGYENWQGFSFETLANPTISPDEIASAVNTMSVAAARQEFGASFNSGGGEHLHEAWWKYGTEPAEGDYYIMVDLAGFSSAGSIKKGALKILDETAIVICKCGVDGWFVKEIISGQWDVRETAILIAKAYKDYQPVKLGIEKGALKNAVGPYLDDEMRRMNRFFLVWDLLHGGKAKPERIKWALQGRLEKGRIILNEEEATGKYSMGWQRKLIGQANDFPTPRSRDDLIDALSYCDQLADVVYNDVCVIDDFEPLDLVSGF